MVILASILVGIFGHGPEPSVPIDGTLPETPEVRSRFTVIELCNIARSKQNLPPLKAVDGLMFVALQHANDMAEKNYFDHTDKSGRKAGDRIKPYAENGCTGENICAGQPDPSAAVGAWLKSSGHRANILNPAFREVGIGFAEKESSDFGKYWVQDFCGRENSYPVVINREAFSTSDPTVQLYVYGKGVAVRMRVRNDDEQFGDWQPFAESITWKLSSKPGLHRVEVQIEDADGLPTTASDTIRLKL